MKAWLLSLHLLGISALVACAEPEPPAITSTGKASLDLPLVLQVPAETFEGARAKAQREGKLLFVDLWARWCAPCVAFRAEVLTDTKALEDRYVVFSLDIDKPEAADYLTQYGSRALPTLTVIDPERKEVLAVLAGAVSREELWAFLDDTASADRDAPGRAELRRAHASYLKNKSEAAAAYEIAAGLLTGRARANAIRSALDAYLETHQTQDCLRLGRAELGNVIQPDLLLAMTVTFVHCNDTNVESAERLDNRKLARNILSRRPPGQASNMVQAETLQLLAQLQRDDGGETEAKATDAERLSLLERAAAEADDPDHAQAFDHMRVKLYLMMGKAPEAIALLQKRVEQRPASYETHGRLGTTLLELDRPRDAIAPLEQAVQLSYGGPKLVYKERLARAHGASGDPLKERTLLMEVVSGWESLPESQREDVRFRQAVERLAAIGGRTR